LFAGCSKSGDDDSGDDNGGDDDTGADDDAGDDDTGADDDLVDDDTADDDATDDDSADDDTVDDDTVDDDTVDDDTTDDDTVDDDTVDDDTVDDDTVDDDTVDDDTVDDDTVDDDTVDLPPVVENTTQYLYVLDEDAPWSISADVTDDVGVDSVTLYYRVDGGSFETLDMTQRKDGTYTAAIPSQALDAFVEYYVEAADTAAQMTTDPANAPTDLYSFEVLQSAEVAYDDGTDEGNLGTNGSGSYSFVRITPPSYPAYLVSMSLYVYSVMGSPVYEPYVVYEPTGTPGEADIAAAVSAGDQFAPTDAEGFLDFTVAGPAAEILIESGDIYIGVKNIFADGSNVTFWGWDLDFPGTDRSWYWWVGDSSWHNAAGAFYDHGIWMFDAVLAIP